MVNGGCKGRGAHLSVWPSFDAVAPTDALEEGEAHVEFLGGLHHGQMEMILQSLQTFTDMLRQPYLTLQDYAE